jgi:hypothetical protein
MKTKLLSFPAALTNRRRHHGAELHSAVSQVCNLRTPTPPATPATPATATTPRRLQVGDTAECNSALLAWPTRFQRRVRAVCVLALLIAGLASASAATRTWDGGSPFVGNWSDAI